MTTLIRERQRWGIGTCVFAILVLLTVFHLTSFNNGVLAEAYPGDLSYLNNYRWQLNALNAPQPQKSVDDDEGYGEVNSFPRFGNPMQKRVEYDAINRIISRLRPTYAKRPRGLSGKRSIDLGLNRGFSGVQAAKHLLGLQAASFHGGPGRKKRTDPAATGATGMGWDQLGQT